MIINIRTFSTEIINKKEKNNENKADWPCLAAMFPLSCYLTPLLNRMGAEKIKKLMDQEKRQYKEWK